MGKVSNGQFADTINAFVTKPTDALGEVDVSREVNFDVRSLDDISLSVDSLLQLTYQDGELRFDSGYRTGKELALEWVEDNLGSFVGNIEGLDELGSEVNILDKVNDINFDSLKYEYDQIANRDLKRSVTDWGMSQVEAVIATGDISTIGNITDVFGSNVLLSYFPDIIGDTLANWDISDYIPNLTYNEYPIYLKETFLPELDKIDPYWDKFTRLTSDGLRSVIPDFTVFSKASEDANFIFTFDERTMYNSVVGNSHTLRTMDEMLSTYRPLYN
jgi:hypothetical protein